jgi:hypothetical protein
MLLRSLVRAQQERSPIPARTFNQDMVFHATLPPCSLSPFAN